MTRVDAATGKLPLAAGGRVDVERIQRKLRDFARQRDWDRYHSPKNLAMALGVEVAELMELFQWVDPEESRNVVTRPADLAAVTDEVADVAIYVIRLADVLGVDLEIAIEEKIAKNAKKYPEDRPHRWSMS